MRRLLLPMALMLAGCQQLPLTPQDLQARKFEAVPGKAVVYVVRAYPDFTEMQAVIKLDGGLSLKTYRGTYYRWEVEPGVHRIAGAYFDSGEIRFETAPGRIYFVLQRVTTFLTGSPQSHFYLVGEPEGRAAVLRSVMVSPGP